MHGGPHGAGGPVLENPVTGERLRWLVTSAQSDGALARAELWLPPGAGRRLPRAQRGELRVQLLAGRVALRVDGARRVLRAGEGATIPAGAPHAWRSVGPGEAHVVVELRPPGDVEALATAAASLARAGRLTRRGRLRPLDAAALLARHRTALAPALPRRLAGALAGALARAAVSARAESRALRARRPGA